MNHLHRALAPIADDGWERIEDEARQMLGTALAGRKLVDVSEPAGWEASAVSLGRVSTSKRLLAKGAAVSVRPRTRNP